MLELLPRLHVLRHVKPGSRGAEVGVWDGSLTRWLLRRRPSHLVLVDSYPATDPTGPYTGVTAAEARRRMLSRIKDREGVEWLQRGPRGATSLEAASMVQDEFLDWLYLDADHTKAAVLADLRAWWPKIRSGGCIIMDDWNPRGWYKGGPAHAGIAFVGEESTAFLESVVLQQAVLRKQEAA